LRVKASKKLLKTPAIVSNASFSTTCPKRPNSIQNSSVLTNFLKGVLNSQPQTEKLSDDLQDAEYLFVAGFQFREKIFLVQIALFHFETPEITKMLHNVYKVSCIGIWEVFFEETFHRRFAVLALNVTGFAIDQNHIGFLQVGESHL
jgi:hypothetical protein